MVRYLTGIGVQALRLIVLGMSPSGLRVRLELGLATMLWEAPFPPLTTHVQPSVLKIRKKP